MIFFTKNTHKFSLYASFLTTLALLISPNFSNNSFNFSSVKSFQFYPKGTDSIYSISKKDILEKAKNIYDYENKKEIKDKL